MNPLLILIVLISIMSSIANKKRKEEMKKAKQSPPTPNYTQRGPVNQRSTQPKMTPTHRQASSPRGPQTNQKTTSGVDSKWPWPTAAEKAQGKAKPSTPSYGGTPRYSHVVTSTLEGGHTHTESSMTGEEDCPPPRPIASKQPDAEAVPAANAGALLSFQTNSVLQGVLYAEILGKPRALQGK